jgi:glycosidase
LFDHVVQLIALRKQHPVLANAGTYHFQMIDDTKQIFVVERRQGENIYLLVVNLSEEEQSLSLEETYESLLDATTMSGTIQLEAV